MNTINTNAIYYSPTVNIQVVQEHSTAVFRHILKIILLVCGSDNFFSFRFQVKQQT